MCNLSQLLTAAAALTFQCEKSLVPDLCARLANGRKNSRKNVKMSTNKLIENECRVALSLTCLRLQRVIIKQVFLQDFFVSHTVILVS